MPCADGWLAAFTFFKQKRDDVVEYWAAATLRENTVAAVKKELGPGGIVTLTNRRLTGQRLSLLKMLPNTVRKLGPHTGPFRPGGLNPMLPPGLLFCGIAPATAHQSNRRGVT